MPFQSLVLSTLLLVVSPAPSVASPPSGDEGVPRGLTVVVVDVGQGSGAVIRAPDGTLHVFDGGPDGEGNASMIPAITRLNPSRFGAVVLSHYHADHHGGLDEVLTRYPFQTAYDRGDVNRPGNTTTTRYLNAAGNRRRTVQIGQVVQLGGGASMTVLCANGEVVGGTRVSFSGRAQEENGRSVAVRIDYGDFSMWLGGDLTGGGNSTADVESPATSACGDIDVYLVNHHGSNTSTQSNLVNRLRPELALASAGADNPFGHPTISTINRLNQAAAARLMMATTRGTGAVGFAVSGDIRVDTDGRRYRATAQNGQFLDFFVDEVTDRAAVPSDIVISEFHRNPARVSDWNGEYVELINVGPAPVSLKDTRISTNGGVFTVFTNLAAYPGRPVVFQQDGDRTRNGGVPLGFVWPYRAVSLGDSGDTIRVTRSSLTLDNVRYDSSYPGGSGVASERRDLLAPPAAANFAAAVTPYGNGDRGSPARRNAADEGCHPAQLRIEAGVDEIVFRSTALSHGGRFSVVGLSFQNGPGFPLLGNHIPLGFDWLFQVVLTLPDFVVPMPFQGYRSHAWPLPSPNALSGATAYGVHLIVDVNAGNIPKVSAVETLVFP